MVPIRSVWAIFLALPSLGHPVHASDDSSPGSYSVSLVDTGLGLTLHKELYLLPYTYSEAYDGAETEVIFQISAKHDIFRTRFYFAYTQISFWQAYDTEASSPFRDTNYNPEIFYRFRETRLGSGSVGADAGFEHESNGQRVPLSRSWNLIYLAPFYRGSDWLAYAKIHYRVPENEKKTPESAEGDDNPDITDYLGYSDIQFHYLLPRGHLLNFVIRGFIGTGKGNVSLNYSFPMNRSEDTFLVARLFNGYGESLLDYDRSITRIGVGLMFNR